MQPKCKNCGSTEFVLKTTEFKTIVEFEEDGKPLTWKDTKVVESYVLCFCCYRLYLP
jgi:hypothetical protein